ncbi:calcium-binding protein [Gimibacter soli]|uniref:Calcium-binding protein n=1 Tax=Gimibacter soli TaxID=3024400 RepID=A0AAE9XTF3_9PROT|nr:calcium-binding protein [Gimibacter soli]WCL53945.1 calcium-binding protein [Gimibacter soli]
MVNRILRAEAILPSSLDLSLESTAPVKAAATVQGIMLTGTSGADVLQGGAGDDSLSGMAGNDTIIGGGGHDSLRAHEGNDLIFAGDGNDNVLAGDGNDTVWAGAADTGDDEVSGQAGDDILGGRYGNDTLVGGAGADTLYGSYGDDMLFGSGTARDGVAYNNTDASNAIWAGYGDDYLQAGHGGDTLATGEGDDTVKGGNGNDAIYGGPQAGNGARNDDYLLGNGGNDSIYGAVGDDYIDGGSGNDLLYAGSGDDTVYGGSGNDTLYAGKGYDYLIGEGGRDQFFVAYDSEFVWISDYYADDDSITILNSHGGGVDFEEFLDSGYNTTVDTADGVMFDLDNGRQLFLSGLTIEELTGAPVDPGEGQLDPDLPEIPSNWGSSATLEIGEEYYSQIDYSGDQDWIILAVDSFGGVEITIEMKGLSSGAGTLEYPEVRGVYDNNGFSLPVRIEPGADGNDSKVSFYAYSPGEYAIIVNSYPADSIGTYILSAEETGPAPEIPDDWTTGATAPTFGSFFGDIETPGDVDWIAVSLRGGVTYQFDLAGWLGVDDAYIYGIYDWEGSSLGDFEDDDSGPGLDARINFLAWDSDIYYIAVGAADASTGGYVLSVEPI